MSIQTFKSPRWLMLYVSLGMMLLGYLGVLVFDRPFTPSPGQPKGQIFSGFDFLCIGFALFGFAGGFLCLISSCWILIVAIASMFRRKHPKQV